ncbi:MAG: pseudouridine synthase [Betaproteobacteria bacterium]|nr:pseudouridine synthase [Betaproteobacteria bacterium]
MTAGGRRSETPPAADVKPAGAASQKLQKVLAEAGLGSRRTMEQWIRDGRVTVNGAVAAIGSRVTPRDFIKVGRREVRWPAPHRAPRVLLYHKPEGEVTSRDDPQGRPTVFDKLPTVRGGKWLAVGRLDYNTCGLLIFTTSGELANRMMHPRFEVEREYAVRLLGRLNPDQVTRMKSGVMLEDGPVHCALVEDAGGEGANHWYRIVLTEGRNRVVRRMFKALGVTVSRLMRVRFGIVSLPPQLKRGRLTEIAPAEVRRLMDWLRVRD